MARIEAEEERQRQRHASIAKLSEEERRRHRHAFAQQHAARLASDREARDIAKARIEKARIGREERYRINRELEEEERRQAQRQRQKHANREAEKERQRQRQGGRVPAGPGPAGCTSRVHDGEVPTAGGGECIGDVVGG